VTQQFCCGAEGLLAGEAPESPLVASLAAGEAVPDVTTEISGDLPIPQAVATGLSRRVAFRHGAESS